MIPTNQKIFPKVYFKQDNAKLSMETSNCIVENSTKTEILAEVKNALGTREAKIEENEN